ncbi:MAG: hypothetical protein B0A82_19725 [Alkalinema sp. CACIAM 70d]|nr:MAG: hypothetical protein B0A82_19725 [Alkalinema sp. CACIAM 70d]
MQDAMLATIDSMVLRPLSPRRKIEGLSSPVLTKLRKMQEKQGVELPRIRILAKSISAIWLRCFRCDILKYAQNDRRILHFIQINQCKSANCD